MKYTLNNDQLYLVGMDFHPSLIPVFALLCFFKGLKECTLPYHSPLCCALEVWDLKTIHDLFVCMLVTRLILLLYALDVCQQSKNLVGFFNLPRVKWSLVFWCDSGASLRCINSEEEDQNDETKPISSVNIFLY